MGEVLKSSKEVNVYRKVGGADYFDLSIWSVDQTDGVTYVLPATLIDSRCINGQNVGIMTPIYTTPSPNHCAANL